MSILKESNAVAFDGTAIKKGDFIRAKYHKWEKAQNGIVAGVTESEIRVLYIPDAKNVTNYYTIAASEVEAGRWEIKWSADLTDIEEETDEGDEDDA